MRHRDQSFLATEHVVDASGSEVRLAAIPYRTALAIALPLLDTVNVFCVYL